MSISGLDSFKDTLLAMGSALSEQMPVSEIKRHRAVLQTVNLSASIDEPERSDLLKRIADVEQRCLEVCEHLRFQTADNRGYGRYNELHYLLLSIQECKVSIKQEITVANPGCCLEILKEDANNSYAWSGLEAHVLPGQQIYVNGESMTALQCLLRAIAIDPCNLQAWHWMGVLGHPATINGTSFTQQDYFLRGLQLDPENANCWYSLSRILPQGSTILIHGQEQTKLSCMIRVVELGGLPDPWIARAWGQLADMMREVGPSGISTILVNGREETQLSCRIRVIEELRAKDLEAANAWYHVAACIIRSGRKSVPVQISGKEFSLKECLCRALELGGNPDPSRIPAWMSSAWYYLGCTMDSEAASIPEPVLIRGNLVHSSVDCNIESLRLNSNNPNAWMDLGIDLYQARTISAELDEKLLSISGEKISARRCFSQGIALLKNNYPSSYSLANAWAMLGATIPIREKAQIDDVQVKGRKEIVDRGECLCRAIQIAPGDARFYEELRQCIQQEGRIRNINGMRMTEAGCINKIDELRRLAIPQSID